MAGAPAQQHGHSSRARLHLVWRDSLAPQSSWLSPQIPCHAYTGTSPQGLPGSLQEEVPRMP